MLINIAESSDGNCLKRRYRRTDENCENPISFFFKSLFRTLLNSKLGHTVTYLKFCNATGECVKVVYSATRNTSNKNFLGNFIHLKWTIFFAAVTSLESFLAAHFYVATKAIVLFTRNCFRKSSFQPVSVSPQFCIVLYRAVTEE